MKKEVRYIAFDGAIFYDEEECANYEEMHMFAGLNNVKFFGDNYDPISKEGYTLKEFIQNICAIKVSTTREAERVWNLLKQYESNEDALANYTDNPFLNKDGVLENRVLIFDFCDYKWHTIPDYLIATFDVLQKVGYRPITLASNYLHYLDKLEGKVNAE